MRGSTKTGSAPGRKNAPVTQPCAYDGLAEARDCRSTPVRYSRSADGREEEDVDALGLHPLAEPPAPRARSRTSRDSKSRRRPRGTAGRCRVSRRARAGSRIDRRAPRVEDRVGLSGDLRGRAGEGEAPEQLVGNERARRGVVAGGDEVADPPQQLGLELARSDRAHRRCRRTSRPRAVPRARAERRPRRPRSPRRGRCRRGRCLRGRACADTTRGSRCRRP